MKKSICVIDDDIIYQLIIGKIIDRSGYFHKPLFYKNATKALADFKSLEKDLPQVMLLDINMPQMDGWQFLEALIKERPDLDSGTDIYIVTSSIAQSDRLKASTYKQVTGFLSKPLTVSKIKAMGEKG